MLRRFKNALQDMELSVQNKAEINKVDNQKNNKSGR